jgi:DNA polymerase
MSLTREDLLRELELLPVWQLREPVVGKTPSVASVKSDIPTEPQPLRIILSDDNQYLFLLEDLKSREEEVLLQNILKAIHIKVHVDLASQRILNLTEHTPKIIIVMGEKATVSLLNLTEQIQNLRGKLYQYNSLPVVVTYHPNHLLKNSEDKAHAWADLCLAKSAI